MSREKFIVQVVVNVEVMADSIPGAQTHAALAFAEVVAGQALVQGTTNEARILAGKATLRRARVVSAKAVSR